MNRDELITEALRLIMQATDEEIEIALEAALNAALQVGQEGK